MECIGINITKIGTESGFRQAASSPRGEKRSGHIQFVTAWIASGNDNDIVRAIGVIPVESCGLALEPRREKMSEWGEPSNKSLTWVSSGV